MKKIISIVFLVVLIFSISMVHADTINYFDSYNSKDSTNSLTSQIVEIKDKELKEIEDYNQAYGSQYYGMTAYILNKIRLYSIPFCFAGIAIAAIYQYVIGIRRIEVREQGFALMVILVTIFVICQILPLIFAIVVQNWRN